MTINEEQRKEARLRVAVRLVKFAFSPDVSDSRFGEVIDGIVDDVFGAIDCPACEDPDDEDDGCTCLEWDCE